MSMDMTLLRLSTNRDRYNRLAPGIPDAGLEKTTMVMLDTIKGFYKEFPDVRDIDIKNFRLWFHNFKHSTMAADDKELYTAIINQMSESVPSGMETGLVERLLSSEMACSVVSKVMQWNEGGEFDLHNELVTIVEGFNERLDRKAKLPLVTLSPEELMEMDEDGGGIMFRLNVLKKHFRPMRGGDFGIFAARPDRGKTTGIASEASYWLPQLDDVWPGENRVGIWFNNEGPGSRIKQRFYQAALGATVPEMVEMVKAKTLTDNLKKVLGNDLGRMQFYDIHDFHSHEVEAIIKQVRPGFIVFDMIDNIKFTGGTVNGGTRTDQLLEEMYKWGRNICVKYDCAGIAMSQVSGDGDGLQFPSMAMLKDSKTGKQGACDFIIMLGALNDPAMERYRYIGAPKNKLQKPGSSKDPRAEVIFDAERARLRDPEE